MYAKQSIRSSPFDNLIDEEPKEEEPTDNNGHHHVSLCVDDLRTTLFIDEAVLNKDNHTALIEPNPLVQSNGKGIEMAERRTRGEMKIRASSSFSEDVHAMISFPL